MRKFTPGMFCRMNIYILQKYLYILINRARIDFKYEISTLKYFKLQMLIHYDMTQGGLSLGGAQQRWYVYQKAMNLGVFTFANHFQTFEHDMLGADPVADSKSKSWKSSNFREHIIDFSLKFLTNGRAQRGKFIKYIIIYHCFFMIFLRNS